MSLDIKNHLIRVFGLPAISALATILIAAAFDPDRNWVRLRALPGEQRLKLVETLKKFDLIYTREQQQALRDLDRRLNELEPAEQIKYFAVLRRYHNWLNRLPEKKQDELKEKPPGERLSLVKKLVAEYPVPKMKTARFLQITDLGDYSPFELAALFKIWQVLTPAQRRAIELVPAIPKRHDALFKSGVEQKIPGEIRPPDYEETRSVGQLEKFASKRPILLFNELKKKQEAVRTEILRRQAINYYFIQNRPHAVTPERLVDFVAAFPSWLQSTFDPYPPDEARRRLTIVYRLVFPFPAEMKASQRPSTPAAGPNASRGAPSPSGKGQAAPGTSPF
ncbi:MAG: hypothetical protein ACHRXM_33600 [Isosphaerales bacterium]